MRRLALLVALLLLAAPLASPAAASPQPTPLCRFCGGLFESAAQGAGVNATVVASEVDVHVRADGHASWVVELELANGSAAFAESPDRLRVTARALADDGYGLPREPSFVDAGIDGDRVTLQYRAPDAAERHAGLLVVDLLHDGGGEPWYHVNADRFTVHGPDGTVVANTPESGRVDGAAVTWTGHGTGEWYQGVDLQGSPYVVFGADRSAATRLRAATAVALATLPILVRGVTQFLLLQTAIFAVLLAAVVAGNSRWSPRPRTGALAIVLAGLGAVGAAVPAVTNGPGWVTGPPLLALGLAGLARSSAAREYLRGPRRQAAAVGGLLLGCYLVLLGLQLAIAGPWADPAAIAFRATALAFPLAAMVPLGGALAVQPDRVRPWFAVAVLGFVALPMAQVNLADPPAGLPGGIFTLAFLAAAVAAPLLGALGLALGWSLATADAPAD